VHASTSICLLLSANFQFLHHLVMIDLPSRPDQLEQRIGRLDRIGQENDIQLHVPYANNTLDHQRLRWYHEGLNAFESICRTGDGVVRALGDELHGLLGEHASVLVDAAPAPMKTWSLWYQRSTLRAKTIF